MNSFGQIYRFTTFGESHGPALGGVIDGMPAGLAVDLDALAAMMARRRPGAGTPGSTSRRESDAVELLSGVFEGVTTGQPIGFVIRNTDARSADYGALARALRPCHADYTYQAKYGVRDYRGGGRSSGRETACRVVAGALAKQALAAAAGIDVHARVSAIGGVEVTENMDAARVLAEHFQGLEGDTLGSVVECRATGMPAGLGEPLYGKLSASLASAIFSIGAVKAFEIGDGVAMGSARGSEVVDPFEVDAEGHISTSANHSGGIQGGISNGADLRLRVTFKPVATLMREISTIDVDGNPVTVPPRGRHDYCIAPRAAVVVEAMVACVLLDHYLLSRCSRL